ncbi:mitochondrial processing peptidase beta subunit [Culex quinquefasciatus]|uniref:Mitochondrial processing peptidase beta subunit n=1 Tax=Culex quinquefasciatus TaxID=7176 RepID=B0WHB9_CULQU|nr:mitochondrial processing peptidase beta subunit [Culex quinquefasciatus]|eukprot:XP_001848103.1 mitochondrial processing peptidase beta subunit [Culex quinquefasciatus]
MRRQWWRRHEVVSLFSLMVEQISELCLPPTVPEESVQTVAAVDPEQPSLLTSAANSTLNSPVVGRSKSLFSSGTGNLLARQLSQRKNLAGSGGHFKNLKEKSSVCCVVVRSVQSVVLHPRRGPRPHPVRPRAVPRVAWFPVDVAVVAREFVPEVSFQSRVAVEETGSNNRSLSGSTAYIDSHYKAPIVLAAASGIKQGDLVELTESYLGKVGSTFDGKASALTPCRFTDSEVRDRDDSLPVALVIIAVLSCGWTNQDNVPLMVANTLISAWYRTQGGGAKNAEDNLCFYERKPDMVFHLQNEWMRLARWLPTAKLTTPRTCSRRTSCCSWMVRRRSSETLPDAMRQPPNSASTAVRPSTPSALSAAHYHKHSEHVEPFKLEVTTRRSDSRLDRWLGLLQADGHHAGRGQVIDGSHPRVRYAACNAIGQTATDFAPVFEKKAYADRQRGLNDIWFSISAKPVNI